MLRPTFMKLPPQGHPLVVNPPIDEKQYSAWWRCYCRTTKSTVRETSVKLFLTLDSDIVQELHNFLASRMTRMFVCIAPLEDLKPQLFEHFFNIFQPRLMSIFKLLARRFFINWKGEFNFYFSFLTSFFIVTVFEGESIILTKKYFQALPNYRLY